MSTFLDREEPKTRYPIIKKSLLRFFRNLKNIFFTTNKQIKIAVGVRYTYRQAENHFTTERRISVLHTAVQERSFINV